MVNFSVEVHSDEPFEKALRRFSVKTKKTGIMRDLKRKRFYTKPSVQKKIDRQKSIRRQKKNERIAELAAAGIVEKRGSKDAKGKGKDGRGTGGRPSGGFGSGGGFSGSSGGGFSSSGGGGFGGQR
jgi:small subunit ribosomal protein S21